jgi:hypothetical protein
VAAAQSHAVISNTSVFQASYVGTPTETAETIRLRTPRETQGGKNLARALGMLGGRENPIGPGTSGFDFTFGSLMEAMRRHPDQIRLVRDNLLDEEDYASAFAADARLNRDTCNEAILASSAHAPSEDMYSVSLGDGFKNRHDWVSCRRQNTLSI